MAIAAAAIAVTTATLNRRLFTDLSLSYRNAGHRRQRNARHRPATRAVDPEPERRLDRRPHLFDRRHRAAPDQPPARAPAAASEPQRDRHRALDVWLWDVRLRVAVGPAGGPRRLSGSARRLTAAFRSEHSTARSRRLHRADRDWLLPRLRDA